MTWQEKAHRRANAMKTGSRFKLVEGDNTFRILPNRSAVLEFKTVKNWRKACAGFPPFIEFLAHRDVGPDKKFIRSGRDVDGDGECWITGVLIPRLEQSSSKSDKSIAKAMAPQEQYIVQVAWLDREGNWQGPGFFYVPGPLRPAIMELLGNLKGRQYDHPKKGKNMTINRTGTGMRDTKYGTLILDEDASEVPIEIIRKVKAFSEVAPEYSETTQQEAWGDDLPDVDEDVENDGDTGYDEEEEEVLLPKRKRKKRKPEPEPEEEEEDEEETEQEDEEIEPEDDDDDDGMDDLGDDEDDEEEEEEEPPPLKRKSRKKAAKKVTKGKKGKRAKKTAESSYEDDDIPF